MANLFSDFEFSKAVLTIIIIFIVGLFFLNRITLKQLIVWILIGFALEHEYLNLRDYPSNSVVINSYKVAESGVSWTYQRILDLKR